MHMTKEEILLSFNEAKNPAGQVQILADLNGCSVKMIKDILTAQGVDPRRMPRERTPIKKPPKDKWPKGPSILTHLLHEREALEKREQEIAEMVPQLQAERERICKKREALSEAYVMLQAVYEEG